MIPVTTRLTSVSDVRQLLQVIGVRPSKALGQNFLVDGNIRGILLRAAQVSPDDAVLEVGPGLGVLTERLVQTAKRLVAVEKDGRLVDFLRRRFPRESRLELVHGDVLDLDLDSLLRSGLWKVVANLPYSVGTRILVTLFRVSEPPARLVVTVQREVGARLCAEAGGREYGLLSVWAQMTYHVNRLKTVSPSCFWPRPDVTSAIVSMRRRGEPLLEGAARRAFYELTKAAFSQRRKQLATVLARGPGTCRIPAERIRGALQGVGAEKTARPEALSVDLWCRLVNALTSPT